MLKLYLIVAFSFVGEGAHIVERNPRRTLRVGVSETNLDKANSLPPNTNSILKETDTFKQLFHGKSWTEKGREREDTEEKEDSSPVVEVIELPQNDKLSPPDTKRVKKIKCNLGKELTKEIESYKPLVETITNHVLYGDFQGRTYDMVAELTDTFGSRMTGSKQLEDSIDWMLNKSREENLQNVHTEPVQAPHWVRNNESLYLLQPRRQKFSLLGLGSSVGTPLGGITAQVLVVRSFEELEKNAEKAKGKIVVYNPPWTTYGEMVQYRVHGASRAAKIGALASLVRSVTPFSINSPHTGWQHYDKQTHKVPTACITPEDAEMLQRFQDRGETIVVNLYMGAQNFPETITRNSISELVGQDLPEEVVVVSGHIDSWDVGVGAMDDAGGSIISWVVPVILQNLGLRPRRTIRTVLFTAEEQGLYGGKAYFEKHSNQKEKFQLLLESDIGTFNPLGLSFTGSNEAKCILNKVLSLLEPLNTTKLATPMSGGPDILMWEKAGFPTGSILNSNDQYFWFHHSEGDTMSVEDSTILDKCAALWTAVAYVVGDLSIILPR